MMENDPENQTNSPKKLNGKYTLQNKAVKEENEESLMRDRHPSNTYDFLQQESETIRLIK